MGKDEAEKKFKELERRLSRREKAAKVSGSVFGLSGIFNGLDGLLKIVAEMDRKGKSEERGTGELKSKGVKIVYGFSIKLGREGIIADKFGNIGEDERGPVVKDEREPLVDLLDEPRQLRLFAEVPGVDEEDIRVNVEDNKVTIHADTDTRKYHKDIPLPCKARMTKSSYKNGVLEVLLEKDAPCQP